MLALSKFNAVMENAFEELAPHKICAYIYELANDFNHFYHEVKILSEENEEKKKGYLALLMLTRDVLESCTMYLDSHHRRECRKCKTRNSRSLYLSRR